MSEVSVVIVDDEAPLRDQLAILINGEADMAVTGSFGSAEEALEGLKAADPQIALVDLGLPGMSGIELIRQIRQGNNGTNVIAFTGSETKETVLRAIKAGATG